MIKNLNYMGVDIGSVSLSLAEIDSFKNIVSTNYVFHHGKIRECLENVMKQADPERIAGIAATTSTPGIIPFDRIYDNRIAVLTAAAKFYESIGSVLIVGGEKFGLIRFDESGNYLNFRANTSCAAGTGGFLDQQARRLGLSGIEELSRLAESSKGSIPKIASRCAVFAKTDLVHAQQEGYSFAEICNGLCYGLAENIVDVLFKGEKTLGPIIFSGGVSKNRAVAGHIKTLTGMDIVVDEYSAVYGAVGAALNLWEESDSIDKTEAVSGGVFTIREPDAKRHYYDPLALSLSNYPDFQSRKAYIYHSPEHGGERPVETDIYEDMSSFRNGDVYLGIDIGSTSTKAVLVDGDRRTLAGFYTRTVGRPIDAVMEIFSAIENLFERENIDPVIQNAGTTGSGRKFIGKLIRADMVLDEITAHARAAYELNPNVDTIFEIGGQDAKFTTLKNGMVNFSIMNTICAAGTGSFIEEQAERLGCPLSEFSKRTENQKAPMASDRCTVFMERDLNHYLAKGYSPDEVLAAALHAVRENYLTKVAVMSAIGETITFQGATAKNKALVAAFENRLGKPIHVSKFCHLTGALGVCLSLIDQKTDAPETQFRGIVLHKTHIPVHSETCQLCANHCKITIADIDGEHVAYGFLCGRDYDTQKFVDNNQSGFHLLKQRKKIFADTAPSKVQGPVIGIPAALYLVEDLPMWIHFFNELGVSVVTSETYKDGVKRGKYIAGAEFCAPVAAMHGHVEYLSQKADYVFLPVYLERKPHNRKHRQYYCYYSQFTTSLLSCADSLDPSKFLTPLVNYIYSDFHVKVELYRMLKQVPGLDIPFFKASDAYEKAVSFMENKNARLEAVYLKEIEGLDDIHVVLLGRPYTVLPKHMNKGIPELFASKGVKTFYEDMIPLDKSGSGKDASASGTLPWRYADRILSVAEFIAQKHNCYPVLITSFKCTPDSFTVEYFKRYMDACKKPYLILQLDEHDSNVGYETRIEAAIRSFRNHHRNTDLQGNRKTPELLIPRKNRHLGEKTIVLPNWDTISQSLVAANLRSEGFDAHLLEQTGTSIQESLKYNSGQCIPLNIITRQYVDYIRKYDLDPAKTAIWMLDSNIACNLTMFPQYVKTLLNQYGGGMEKLQVYTGTLFFYEFSSRLALNTFFAYMFGGLLRKMACKIRPYEICPGQTDAAVESALNIFSDAFHGNRSKEDAAADVVAMFNSIPTKHGVRSKVAIFGDLYARDNETLNQDLVRYIEANGGEVITTPYSSYAKMISRQYLRKWFIEGKYKETFSSRAMITVQRHIEKSYSKYFNRILRPESEYDDPPEKILSEYNVRLENTGEAMDNILKLFYLARRHPDLSLFVQTSPAFCCPSLISEAMSRRIERNTGVPVVSITYDGTGSFKNDIIIPYLKYPRKRTPADPALTANAD